MSYYGGGNANQGNSSGYYGQQQNSQGGSSQQYNGANQQYGQQQQQQQQPPPQQQQYGYQNSYGDNSGWQQQQQQQQTLQQNQAYGSSQYIQQPQPSATSGAAAPTFWNPSTAASMAIAATTMASGGSLSNDAMLDFANAAGKSFFQSGAAQMIPGLESSMLTLRSYFAVDNKYVIRKMKRFLLPILSDKQGWQRQVREYATPERPTIYQLPIHDECAPDLYLPVMSFITYVLLSAMCYGSAGEFSPEVIPDVATKCAIYQTIEVLIFRGGFYSMQVPISFLDLFSYTGYKYVGLCMNMIAGIIVGTFGWFGTRGYYACFLWTATASAYFMLKTMSNNIPLQTSPVGPKREMMVLAFGALQYLTMWLVSQTKAFDDVIKKGKSI